MLFPSRFSFANYAALSSRKEQADLSYKPDLLLQSEQEAKRLVEERLKIGSWAILVEVLIVTILLFSAMARMPDFASEGQQRGLVLALRFAEFFSFGVQIKPRHSCRRRPR